MLPFSSPFSLDLIEYGRAARRGRAGASRRTTSRRGSSRPSSTARGSTEQEFGTFFILLTTAGNETTRHTISLGLRRPPRRTPTSSSASSPTRRSPATAADELLRRAHPVHHFRRTATRDVEIHGRRIERGDKVDDLVRGRELRRGEVRRPVPPRRRPDAEPARHVRARRAALLPRRAPREARDQDLARGDGPVPRRGSSWPASRCGYARTSSTASSDCRYRVVA